MCALAKGTLMCVTSLYKEGSRIQFTGRNYPVTTPRDSTKVLFI